MPFSVDHDAAEPKSPELPQSQADKPGTPAPPEPPQSDDLDFSFLIGLSTELAFVLVAFLLAYLIDLNLWPFLRWDWHEFLWGVLATLPMLVIFFFLDRIPWQALQETQVLVDESLHHALGHCRIWQLALIALAAGLGEEILFRGTLQWLFTKLALDLNISLTAALIVGLILSSIFFGVAHAITPIYAVLTGLVGLYLGGLWIGRDGSLIAPIVAHALYDFIALVYLLRWQAPPPSIS